MSRLTEQKTTKGITEIVIRNSFEINDVVHKLCLLEDILDKYGIENVEELDKTFEYVNKLIKAYENGNYKKEKQELIKERDTWQKACELACNKLVDELGSCPVDNDNWEQDNSWCKEHCGENEELLCWDRYFYQQAKKEVNDE